MTRIIQLETTQIHAILGTIQNEIVMLTQKITESIRDKNASFGQTETLITRRNELIELMKVLEEKLNESI